MNYFTKIACTLACIVATSFAVVAQNQDPFETNKSELQQIYEVNSRSGTGKAQKPTAEDVRLIAKAQWSYVSSDFVLLDSTHADWSGNNGAKDFGSYNNFDKMTDWMAASDGSDFDLFYKIENDIDASGIVNTSNVFSRDNINNIWEQSQKITYTYTNSLLTERVAQYWKDASNTWQNDLKHTYTYNNNGLKTESLVEDWDGSSWVNSSRVTGYNYNANNQLTMSISQNFSGGNWVNSRKHIYLYDSNGDNTEDIAQAWKSDAWVNSSKVIHTFTNHNVTEMIRQKWDGTGWVNESHDDYTYGNHNEVLTSIGQSWNVGNFWETAHGDSKLFYYYETYSKTTGIKDLAKEINLKLYPNPAINILNISINRQKTQNSTFRICDITGRERIAQSLGKNTNNTRIDISALPAGSYFLKINTEDGGVAKAFQVVK